MKRTPTLAALVLATMPLAACSAPAASINGTDAAPITPATVANPSSSGDELPGPEITGDTSAPAPTSVPKTPPVRPDAVTDDELEDVRAGLQIALREFYTKGDFMTHGRRLSALQQRHADLGLKISFTTTAVAMTYRVVTTTGTHCFVESDAGPEAVLSATEC
jgi:hypothetical protein